MTMLEYLEKDKDRFMEELAASKIPQNAEKVIEQEADRLLLLYNEHCEDATKRDAAAYMMQTARMSAALLNTVGETKIWEDLSSSGKAKAAGSIPLWSKILLGAGALCGLGAYVVALLADPSALRATDVLLALLLAIAAPSMAFLAGKSIGRSNPVVPKGRSNYRAENHIDPQKTYIGLRNMILAVDQNLEGIMALPDKGGAASETSVGGSDASGTGSLDKASIDLFADLLEASCSKDGEYAMEKLADIRFYLHKKGVEAVDYDGSNKALFDMMPSAERRTLRPALVMDEKVVKKGLASEGRA